MATRLRSLFNAAALTITLAFAPSFPAMAQTAWTIPDTTTMTYLQKDVVADDLLKGIRESRGTPAEESAALEKIIAFTHPSENTWLRNESLMKLSIITHLRPAYATRIFKIATDSSADTNAETRTRIAYILGNLPQVDREFAPALDILENYINDPIASVAVAAFLALSNLSEQAPGYENRIVEMTHPHILHSDSGIRAGARYTLQRIIKENLPGSDAALDAIMNAAKDTDRKVVVTISDDYMGQIRDDIFAFTEFFSIMVNIAVSPNTGKEAQIVSFFKDMIQHKDNYVRKMAIMSLGTIAASKPAYLDSFLAIAKTAITDPAADIREETENALSIIWPKAPHEIDRIADMIARSLAQEDILARYVKKINMIADIGLAHDAKLPMAMDLLRRGAQDSNYAFRRSSALTSIRKVFAVRPAQREEIFNLNIKYIADPEPAVAQTALRGLHLAVEKDSQYALRSLQAVQDMQASPPADENTRVEIARTGLSVFQNADRSFERPSLDFLQSMQGDESAKVRNTLTGGLTEALTQRPEHAHEILTFIESMLIHKDPITRIKTIASIGLVGEKIAAQSERALDILRRRAVDPAEEPAYKAQAATKIGDIGFLQSPRTADAFAFLAQLVSDPNTAVVNAALRGIAKIGESAAGYDERAFAILAPFENSPESSLRNTVRPSVERLRKLLEFRTLRNQLNDEAAMSARLPKALSDLATAQDMLPPAIAILQQTATDPILRLKISDIIGQIGHAHAPLALDAATALAEVIVPEDTGNHVDTRRTMLQRLGLIGMTHETAAPVAVAAMAQLTGNADPTISGMAITAIGMIGHKYPATCAMAAQSLRPVVATDDTRGRTARKQLEKLNCPAP